MKDVAEAAFYLLVAPVAGACLLAWLFAALRLRFGPRSLLWGIAGIVLLGLAASLLGLGGRVFAILVIPGALLTALLVEWRARRTPQLRDQVLWAGIGVAFLAIVILLTMFGNMPTVR
ncbi:MAG TPA: hypothetical protein VJ867_07740 [Gemmatimonadaceae bacterium]|nr:hypothetical protein [Gemmatimonadaceae bacterium]